MTDFSNITPCGGDCTSCAHYKNDECTGCIKNGGKCVSMWENSCTIYECCAKHGALFCGVCSEFPCEWLVSKISEWDKHGIERLRKLGSEYMKEHNDGKA